MSNICSNCGESKAMYCPQCMHKLQKRVEKLEARTITIDMLKRCKDDDAWMFASNLNAMLQGDRQ